MLLCILSFFKKLPYNFKIPNMLYFKLTYFNCVLQNIFSYIYNTLICLFICVYIFILMYFPELIIITAYKIFCTCIIQYLKTKTPYKVCLYMLPEKSILFLEVVPCDKTLELLLEKISLCPDDLCLNT